MKSATELQTALSALFTRWESAEARYYAAGRSLASVDTDAAGLEYTDAWTGLCRVVAAARDLASRIQVYLRRSDFDAARGDMLSTAFLRDALPLLEEDDPNLTQFCVTSRGLLLLEALDAPPLPEHQPGPENVLQASSATQELIVAPSEPPPHPACPPGPPPALMTPAQAAAYLGLSEKAVRHQIADGKLPILRRGRRVFVNTKELDRLIAANTELPARGYQRCQEKPN